MPKNLKPTLLSASLRSPSISNNKDLIMRKIVILLSWMCINTTYAVELLSYQQTENALNDGKRITYVIHWDDCQLNIPNIKPNFSSHYSPSNVNFSKSGIIQSRGMVYSHQIESLPQLGSVNQAFDYQFDKSGELHVVNRFLDPVTYSEKMMPLEITCQLGKGFKVFA